MALSYPVARKYVITTLDHTKFLILGNAVEGQSSTWCFDFVPDANFDGTLTVVARGMGKDIDTDGVGFVTVPFRSSYLNTTPGIDHTMIAAGTTIFGRSLVEVPATGFSIALLAGCVAGSGVLYSWPTKGNATP